MPEPKRDDIMVWCDIETFDLPAWAPILELGFRVVDLDLNLIDSKSWLVWESSYFASKAAVSEYVRNMHTKNNLFADAEADGRARYDVERDATDWLRDNEYDGNPMCGSSLNADKAWLGEQMPLVLESFHYRIIDCSSLKEVCRRYNKPVFDALPVKEEHHRVDPDLVESVEEFRHYLDNFLWDGRD